MAVAAPAPNYDPKNKQKLVDARHPFYTTSIAEWRKWRLCYEGGTRFIHQYLRRFSKREDDQDFLDRKFVTYNPAFAKAAINEVKNAIFQRTCDIAREGGSDAYQNAVEGLDNGVDLLGSTMNAFMGRRLLPELLVMGRVGVYVDMPIMEGNTLLDAKGKRPYLYYYPAEDILSWTLDDSDAPNEFNEVLLSDSYVTSDGGDQFYLPYNTVRRYRHIWKQWNKDGSYDGIYIQFYDSEGRQSASDGTFQNTQPIKLNIPAIPFVLLELSDSLMTDISNYQIALLNLASSDMAYTLKANFPFYVEQFDPRMNSPFIKNESPNAKQTQSTNNQYDPTGSTVISVQQDKVAEVKVGIASGRKYPTGTNAPAFIHPSSEPLLASMKKQEQLKQEVRELIALAITNLTVKAGSKQDSNEGDSGLEAGLSYIGLELEHAERRIAIFWAAYEGAKAATVKYPENYSLKSDADRRKEAADLELLMPKLPSKTAQKEIAKAIARVLLGAKVSNEIMTKIEGEIDSAVVVTTDPDIIKTDFESGFVGLETASKIRGYPAGEVEKAAQDHADRVARIAIAQAEAGGMAATAGVGDPASRGVADKSGDPKAPGAEKKNSQDPATDPNAKAGVRGEGK